MSCYAASPHAERAPTSFPAAGTFHTSGTRFDSKLAGLTITRVGDGVVEASLTVHEGVANAYGTLHGGAAATLVDVLGTAALLTRDPLRPGVSVELSTTYVSAAKVGARLHIVGRVLRAGKRLGFTAVEIFQEPSQEPEGGAGGGGEAAVASSSHGGHGGRTLVASGRHTKAL
jgi:acyl-coenzyme A thioesterase 13